MSQQNIILFDSSVRDQLLPLTFTKPVAELRIGITTIKEKWQIALDNSYSYKTQDYLSGKFPIQTSDVNICINGAVIPNKALVDAITRLSLGEAIVKDEILIACCINKDLINNFSEKNLAQNLILKTFTADFISIKNVWDIFALNTEVLEADFNILSSGKQSAAISSSNQVINKNNIFIEAGAKVECATLNADTGPIYISKDAEVMEGATIRGPFALGEKAVVKMGAKIYGATTIGPHSKVGGELNNVVIQGYSNKAHDGFLGNSVIGEWCNLGADTNCSNLKNNYSNVKVWNYPTASFENSERQFCGLIMGDHSKTGINTMFNTGTVVGVCSNIFNAGFPDKFIPSFSWGSSQGFETFKLEKAKEVAENVYKRRGLIFKETDYNIFKHIFETTAPYRK